MESSMFYTYFTLKYHKKNMLNKMQTNYNEYRHVGLWSLTNWLKQLIQTLFIHRLTALHLPVHQHVVWEQIKFISSVWKRHFSLSSKCWPDSWSYISVMGDILLQVLSSLFTSNTKSWYRLNWITVLSNTDRTLSYSPLHIVWYQHDAKYLFHATIDRFLSKYG